MDQENPPQNSLLVSIPILGHDLSSLFDYMADAYCKTLEDFTLAALNHMLEDEGFDRLPTQSMKATHTNIHDLVSLDSICILTLRFYTDGLPTQLRKNLNAGLVSFAINDFMEYLCLIEPRFPKNMRRAIYEFRH